MFERSQRSVEREVGAGGDFKAKRTASAQGLDRSTEGRSGVTVPDKTCTCR